MVRSEQVTVKFANTGKKIFVEEFLVEYRRVANLLMDYYFTNGLNSDGIVFSIPDKKYDFPSMLQKKDLPENIDTFLSGRALKCLTTQVCGIIQGLFAKRKKQIFIKEKFEKEGKKLPKKLLERIEGKLSKPDCSFINAELNSICCSFTKDNRHFNGFITLSSLRSDIRGFEVQLPVKFHRNLNKWNKKGEMLNSFLVSEKTINFRFRVEPKVNESTKVVGADQGLKTVLTLSDGTKTPDTDSHNHSLESIILKMARKRKGSKAFGKAQDHRENYINWSINQLNFSNLKEIKLEKVVNINFGKRVSRKMQAWTNTKIRDKVIRFAEEHDVHVVLQDCTYRSQRCSCCGLVRKANRKGKIYSCKKCGNTMDADLNASKNHEQILPDLPWTIRNHKLNLKDGFYWKPEGLFNYDGTALTVPFSIIKKTDIN